MSELINNSENRKKKLKELILKLHLGHAEDEVRHELMQSLSAIPYGEVVEGSLRVAAALRGERASLEGERVAVLVSPGADFVASVMGVVLAGGTGVVLTASYEGVGLLERNGSGAWGWTRIGEGNLQRRTGSCAGAAGITAAIPGCEARDQGEALKE